MCANTRVWIGLMLLAAPAWAGCVGGNAEEDGSALASNALGTLAVVHAPLAASSGGPVPLLDADTWAARLPNAPLPSGVARYVGGPAFEPTLGVTPDGALFYSSHEFGVPDIRHVSRSLDDGATWEDVTPRVSGVSVPPDTNDPYVYVDPDTGRVFLSNLHYLACSSLGMSDDAGESWTFSPIGCGHPFGVHDHQTVFTSKPRTTPTAGYPNLVWYCVNRIVDSACATSVNGGLSFGALRPLVYAGVDPTSSGGIYETGLCGGLHGHGVASPDGTVYLPKGQCGVPSIAFTQDDGLTWTNVVISEDVPMNRENVTDAYVGETSAPEHEVTAAVDEAGNVYAVWNGPNRKPYVAASTDGGATWGEPRMVAPPGVGTTAFATIAAGVEGRVVVAYYGTSSPKEYQEMDDNDTWNGYLTTILDAHTDAPVAATVTVNDPADPLARGICGGTRCDDEGENYPGVGDFIDVVVGPDGRPWAAFVDVCLASCAAAAGPADGTEALVGTFGAGPALRGDGAALPLLVSTGMPAMPARPASGLAVFAGEGHVLAHARGAWTFPVDERSVPYGVGLGATSILLEVAWNDPMESFNICVFRANRTPGSCYEGPGAGSGETSFARELEEREQFAAAWYTITIYGDLAVNEDFRAAASVFYDVPVPEGYSALGADEGRAPLARPERAQDAFANGLAAAGPRAAPTA